MMLIGLNPSHKASPSKTDGDIFDVTSETFEATALKESLSRPVFIEFWAPWCGPCKQLLPVMEKIVKGRAGQLALAKVNIGENPELAQAFRVQSVPMVVALYQGQPVTGFAGVRPQSDIEKLADQLVALHRQNQPEALDIPAIIKDANQKLADGDVATAHALYAQVLSEDPHHVDAYVGMVRVMIVAGQLDQAGVMMAEAPDTLQRDARFVAAKTAYQLALHAPQGDIATAETKVAQHPQDCQAHFDLAELYYADGQKDKAADCLLTIMRINRGWEDEKARKQLLAYLEAWGFSDPASVQARRKLSTLLFA